MSSYISRSACRGSRPKNVKLRNLFVRDELIGKLMKDRDLVRVINAPKGYGKSTLAAQYAEIIFSFNDVYWFNCKSPCFFRDLDSDNLFEGLVDAKLVVFDDLPHLDGERLTKFLKLINKVTKKRIEVIILLTPFDDSVSEKLKSNLIISHEEMLLSDSEVEKYKIDLLDDSLISRIILLYKSKIKKIIECSLEEDFVNDVYVDLFNVYIFGKGDYKLYKTNEIYNYLSKKYCYFGYDENSKSFRVPYISVKKLCASFGTKIDLIIKKLDYADRDSFGEDLAEKLIGENNYSRAIEVLQNLCVVDTRYEYLKKLNVITFNEGVILESNNLYNSIMAIKKEMDSTSVMAQTYRKLFLGDKAEAIRYAYRVLDNPESTVLNKLMCAFVFMECGTITEKQQSLRLIKYFQNNLINSNISYRMKQVFIYRLATVLSEIYLGIYTNSKNVFDLWSDLEDYNISIISAICILRHFDSIKSSQLKMANHFFKNIYRHLNNGKKNFYYYLLAREYLEMQNRDEQYFVALNSDILNDINAYLNKFEEQREKYNDISKINQDKNKEITKDSQVPFLEVKLFGGLEVSIDNRQIINKAFARQKVKVLMSLLALEKGNELGKDYLANVIWPECDIVRARRNLNSIWSIVNKLIGSPYLLRNQKSYKLNSELVQSDASILDSICSDLTMGPVDSSTWYDIIKNNKRLLDSDLLPSEEENLLIKKRRMDYKNKVVDAYLAASRRLLEIEELDSSLWFAKQAIERDSKREDVYINLMSIQLKCNQRTTAIETYFSCKKFLDSEYGLDISSNMEKMYKKAINEIS